MGKYHRKSNRGSYPKEKLKEAVEEVKSGRMSGYRAAISYQIPRMTIMDHVNKKRKKSATLGRNTALSPEIEYKLATGLHLMEKNGFGLTRQEVLQMVGEYINKNNLITPFKNGTPGKDWFSAFKERHGLSIKKPQAVEYARKRAMDPFIIYPYFDLLQQTITDLNLKYKPSSIWNLDETSFSKDPAKTKIVGVKGHAATRIISSSGKDNTTVLLGASASGEKTAPLIVYKGKNVWDTWTSSEAYPGTSYAATKNGWMETEVFESFFKKTFLPAVKDQRPILLIYDGHSTHVGLNIIEEARKENITILKLPPHTSHVLQPLDIAVMKSFKDRWDALLVQWQRLNVGTVMPKSEFARLIGQVWGEIDSQVLRNGFKKAGIYPVNRYEINENLFDSLKLRHWREFERTKNVVDRDEISKNPKSLLTLVINFLNKSQTSKKPATLEEINNFNKPPENPTQDHIFTFEELLLQKVKRADSSIKPRRRKIAPGAEVITHNDVLEKRREEQRKNAKPFINKNQTKNKRARSQSFSKTINNDVIYLSDIPKNDCQLRAFTAKDISNLPPCLQNQKPNNPKIKILSDIVIKESNSIEVINTRNQKNKGPKYSQRTQENPIPPGMVPSGMFKATNRRRTLSSSTTSVSGSISTYSDSDIEDIISDSNNTLLGNDDLHIPITLNTVDNINLKKLTPCTVMNTRISNEDYQELTYDVGDDILVRYHGRQRWTYYVGRIESIKIINGELFYSTIFYKTIKKPNLVFRKTKKVDRDDVPSILIVKKIDLKQDPVTLNYFFDSDENSIYF